MWCEKALFQFRIKNNFHFFLAWQTKDQDNNLMTVWEIVFYGYKFSDRYEKLSKRNVCSYNELFLFFYKNTKLIFHLVNRSIKNSNIFKTHIVWTGSSNDWPYKYKSSFVDCKVFSRLLGNFNIQQEILLTFT